MGRRAVALAALVLVPALAGCFFEEELDVALRVSSGQTLVIDRDRVVEGTLLVRGGGTLVLEDVTLRIAQALVLEPGARVVLHGGLLKFSGSYSRQNIESSGDLVATGTIVEGLRDLRSLQGTVELRDAKVRAESVRVEGGEVRSHGTDWRIGTMTSVSWTGSRAAVELTAGVLDLQNGTFLLDGDGGLLVHQGEARFRNLTFEADLEGGDALATRGGLLVLENVGFEVQGADRFLRADGGTMRFVDAPIPNREDVLTNFGSGRIEVGWTLTARAVTPPGGIPVGGVNVTLTSMHDPSAPSASGVTDENGEVRLVALQYVADRWGSRSGNPHALTVSGGGKTGAMGGIVMEAPATVVVPVFG